MTISIEELTEDTFKVTIISDGTTTHTVTVTDDVHRKLTNGAAGKADLLDFSFRFLLKREPNTSILSRFDLPVISTYFPEFEDEVRKMSEGKF